jgi:hydroxymethylglutaryl-CoA reductase (NADPH)
VAAPNESARRVLERILEGGAPEARAKRLAPRPPEGEPLGPRLPATHDASPEGTRRRLRALSRQGVRIEALAARTGERGEHPAAGGGDGDGEAIDLAGNIENFVGFARVPVGVIGPLRVNGIAAHGDFHVPLATTEGALVASYDRGARLVSLAGGVSVFCLTESVARAPCFVFRSLAEAGLFLSWALPRFERLQELAAGTSSHCRLVDLKTAVAGKEVYLVFEYTTGDAGGQNMVTLATDHACRWLARESPVTPERWYIEGNMSGDKKATVLAFAFARGKKVVAEAVIPRELVRRLIHTEPEEMVRYWEVSLLGGVQSGSIGVQGHFANALAALFIACGQDVACVSEAAVGLTRLDVAPGGDLYVSVSLPNLIVGTVGGGTHLPTARECLEMLGCRGDGGARKFAEICAATALAGEVSISGALAAGDFARAHARYGRKPRK